MNALIAAYRVGFRHVLAYRAEAAVQLVSIGLIAALNGSLWSAATRSAPSIAGLSSPELLAYVVAAWSSVSFVATRINEDIGMRFREGLIAADLVRPVDLQAWWYARDLGRACAILGLHTLPLLAASILAFGPPLPDEPARWALWLVSLVLAHATNFGVSFLVGIAALPLHDVTGLSHLKATLVSVFSGALIPLALFPPIVRDVALCLPFHAMAHAPATVLLGQDDAARVLSGQLLWALGLWVIGALTWQAARRVLVVQGG